ncbi:NUDIX hydrolase [Marinactinospora thermotolerans]|uniref:NUDIX hydrolase n=1 Tax=Marinactinospora thermotolerans TaxID=531310 RepID=UPI003D8FE7F5
MKTCCGTSVGVLIEDQEHRLLMVTRGWWPKGTAPVAGHVRDAHTSVAEALVAEVQEETGLTVTESGLLWEGHLPNLCASLPHVPDPGHYWWVYRATATGVLTPAPGETKGASWYTRAEVDALAAATLDHYRNGGLPADQPDASLEAVWLRLMWETGHLRLTVEDLALAETAYSTAPDAYWLGGRR